MICDDFSMQKPSVVKITGVGRREIFRKGGTLASLNTLVGSTATPARPTLEIGRNIYRPIGVRRVINCKGTFTIVSGSPSLPDVKCAMEEASRITCTRTS